MKSTELIFFPAPGTGHLVSAVEFAKRLLAHDPHLSVTILLINSPWTRGTTLNLPKPSQQDSSRTTLGGIRCVDLPEVNPPSPELFKESIEHCFSEYIAAHRPHVRDAIARLRNSSTDDHLIHIAGLVLDMFCTSVIDIATEFSIPSYVFFCSSAAFLGFILHLPAHSEQSGVSRFDESEPDHSIPCFENRVPGGVLPGFAFNKLGYKAFMDHASRFKDTKGILVNTCAELEPYALKSLSDAYETAPVYTVGPVLDLDFKIHRQCDASERERIMGWLDKQPESSVVFLCFGSGGSFNEDQIREISIGLSQSGQRFLWSFRKPPSGAMLTPSEYSEAELRGILGDDFWGLLEEGRGQVCGWAPQLEILGHQGTGAFVTHCGWNSTLEGVWFGKPLVTWPMYAEQQLNAFELVRELGMAVELTLDYKARSRSVVEASDIEKAVRSVMDEHNPVRHKAKEMAEVCRGSLMEGGSSYSCVDRLIRGFMGETADWPVNANLRTIMY